MSLDSATVSRIARLARIRLSDHERDDLVKELNAILGWVEQLSELDTAGVEPMTSVEHVPLKQREDVVTDGGKPDAVLGNAPEKAAGYFVVPKVVE